MFQNVQLFRIKTRFLWRIILGTQVEHSELFVSNYFKSSSCIIEWALVGNIWLIYDLWEILLTASLTSRKCNSIAEVKYFNHVIHSGNCLLDDIIIYFGIHFCSNHVSIHSCHVHFATSVHFLVQTRVFTIAYFFEFIVNIFI